MARTHLVAGNWKMNMTLSTGTALAETLVQQAPSGAEIDVVICPPFLLLPRIKEVLRNQVIHLGAQDVFWAESGAFTGQISASMLAENKVSHCIVGHSETRGRFGKLETPESTLGYFAETNETINLKIKALLYQSIFPILCVGETLAEREAGQAEQVIAAQLEGALAGLDSAEMYLLVVAYEPVWAIGTGQTCSAADAEAICGFIRGWFAQHHDPELAEHIRILYGGSVKAANAAELFQQPNIDGGLVGGASLDAQEFIKIMKAAAKA